MRVGGLVRVIFSGVVFPAIYTAPAHFNAASMSFFLGKCAVQWLKIRRPFVPYLFLFLSLGAGWYVAHLGGFASTSLGRLETSIVLTLPMLFSGIVFSTLLSSKGHVSGMAAMNLLGQSAVACWNISRCTLASDSFIWSRWSVFFSGFYRISPFRRRSRSRSLWNSVQSQHDVTLQVNLPWPILPRAAFEHTEGAQVLATASIRYHRTNCDDDSNCFSSPSHTWQF
jgi:hypothetical protein